ncbi:MAG TPA: ABC transporter permease [Gemmatimonadaceae bacterium]|nr:ABC transporter permease [Gemmatimonadaceae bacterium]
MPTGREMLRNLRMLVARRAVERDLDDELRGHLEMQTRMNVAQGMTPEAARDAAYRVFGSMTYVKEELRAVHGRSTAPVTDLLGRDLRLAARTLLRHRRFTTAIVLILALGIGSATLMFSIVSGVLLRPLPYAHPERIVMIWGNLPNLNMGFQEQPLGGDEFRIMRRSTQAFQTVAAFQTQPFNLGTGVAPERVDGARVTSDFFRTIGVRLAIGRGFARTEETPGRDHVVVLSWALWQRRFSGDTGVIGTTVVLNAEPYVVIGVAPQTFAFPRGAQMPANFQFPPRTQLWVPMRPRQSGPRSLAVIGRMRPDITMARAQEDLDRITRIEDDRQPARTGWFGTRAVPLRTQMIGHVRTMLLILLAAVAVLLAIACANAAQLLLARLQGRRKELALRAAIGASSPRIVRELMIESLLVTALAGVLGTLLGMIGISVARTIGPDRLPRLATVRFDARVALIAIAITMLSGLLFSLLPAIGASHVQLGDALRRGGRRAGDGAAPSPARRMLIAVEVALSVVLLVSSGLLIRSLVHELGGDLGFEAPHGITFEVTLPPLSYPETPLATSTLHPKSVPFFTEALQRLRAIPGVDAAAIGKPLPMSGEQDGSSFFPENGDLRLYSGKQRLAAEYTVASPGLFHALGTPIVSGRDFSVVDQQTTVPVVIINQAMGRWLWPGRNPIGKRLKLGRLTTRSPWMTVVGVVENMKLYSLTQAPRPEMFVPYTQSPFPSFSTMQFLVRSSLPPAQILGPVRRAIASVDPTIPVARVRTVDQLVASVSETARFATLCMSLFGGAALLLAMVGLYGVIAYTVHQRRQEFGIRAALGATRWQIVQLVVRDGLRLTVVGLAAGGVLSVLAGWLLRPMLYEVSVVDPATLAGAGVLLLGAALAACLLPAARASAVRPRAALDDL